MWNAIPLLFAKCKNVTPKFSEFRFEEEIGSDRSVGIFKSSKSYWEKLVDVSQTRIRCIKPFKLELQRLHHSYINTIEELLLADLAGETRWAHKWSFEEEFKRWKVGNLKKNCFEVKRWILLNLAQDWPVLVFNPTACILSENTH